MIARKYRRLGRPPGRTGKGGTRPRTAKGGGRRTTRIGCPLTLAAALLPLFGAVFLAVGLGAAGTTHPAPRPTPHPASTFEREAHDLHQQLELIRLCRSATVREWPCVEATP